MENDLKDNKYPDGALVYIIDYNDEDKTLPGIPWSAKVKFPLGANFWHITRVRKFEAHPLGGLTLALYGTTIEL